MRPLLLTGHAIYNYAPVLAYSGCTVIVPLTEGHRQMFGFAQDFPVRSRQSHRQWLVIPYVRFTICLTRLLTASVCKAHWPLR